jgi:hypothetical protein
MKNTTTYLPRRSFCAALSLAILSMVSVVPASAKEGESGSQSQSRSRTPLAGPVLNSETPNGHADFRVDSGHNRTRLNVEVQDVNLAQGTKLTVVIDRSGTRTTVGSIQLDALHSGELELNSEDGDSVPAVQKGDIVIVMNGNSAILTGVF